ncbi:MotA/TolQ/ExbB proton channel family protein [Pelagicoccus sp. SDUM812003]|uniref:MotA/TolQ/ExbB proton channel family protein n=1 Tax=Pelagicoccus sp. SDUM812003 TaxID=3041267 RepID=UPI00280E049B|nr:MotA/TolQ/ExbB proton channel family protein [Pelagicoccus sp. SDUM812003]MDQ8204771.1 MotA/TolQ/ExbB proton channel family protein [Pelagicoccus sp. SDUM812003]
MNLQPLAEAVEQSFRSGGIPMAGLATLSIILYSSLFASHRFVARINRAAKSIHQTQAVAANAFPELRIQFREAVRSRLKFARVLIVSAPLLGLLGTVIGMLKTFQVLSETKSLDTTQAVADGISMALVTTQAGLMVALPALFITESIRQKSKRCEQSLFARPHANIPPSPTA